MLKNLVGKTLTFHDLLSETHHQQLKEFVSKLPFETPSLVFNTLEKKDEIEPSVRKSKSVILENEETHDLINKFLLEPFKKQNPSLNIQTARNHITFIKYDKGDFFDWHKDHEKFIINKRTKWLEMQFIYCIVGPEEGGELQIITTNSQNKRTKKEFDEVSTENCAIIFDKVMEHSGTKVGKGTKIIVTLDLLVSTQDLLNTDQYTIQTERLVNSFNNGNIPMICSYSKESLEQLVQKQLLKHPFGMFKYIQVTNKNSYYHIFLDHKGIIHYISPNESKWSLIDVDNSNDSMNDHDNQKIIDFFDNQYQLQNQKKQFKYDWRNPLASNNTYDSDYTFIELFSNGVSATEIESIHKIVDFSFPPKVIDYLETMYIPTDGLMDAMENIDLFIERETIPPRTEVGYSYHCNESNYDTFEVDIVYGICPLKKLDSDEDSDEDSDDE